MTSLTTTLTDFQDYLLGISKNVEQAVKGPSKSFIKKRLAIYREAYQLRLLDILKIDFPCLRPWLGNNAFEKLGLAYIDKYPSRFFSAREFGQYMATYLATTEPYNKNSFLAEFTHFERTLSETIDSPDASIVTVEDVIAIPPDSWPTIHFTLHPAVTLLTLNWNIADIHKALMVDELKIKRRPFKKPASWLIWRNNIDVKYRELDEKETFIIKACSQAMCFEEICQGLVEWLPEHEAAQYIVQFLQVWLPEQLFSRLTFKAPDA